MKDHYKIHLISNTHWDREWLYNFQETRMMLVEFLDGLLDTLENYPAYRSFVLDSQAVPVEDYLAVRPENKARIVDQVSAGRLLIGPWYTCPEGFEVNGESLIRNLLIGHKVAAAFGHVMKVGHTPFSYGQNSQMPQIYAGFGIDTILFYHGVSHDEVANEWIFEGADGTRILGSQMSSGARYNFYHGVYRPCVVGKTVDEREYEWRDGFLPFHRASLDQALSHYMLLEPPRTVDRDRLKSCVAALRDAECDVATTRHLAFMMGHDSSVADPLEIEMLEAAREALPGVEIVHGHYEEMMAAIKADADPGTLTVLRGERRVPKPMPIILHLYSDVLSSRTRMKYRSSLAEYLIQLRVEPFAVAAAFLGADYPHALLETAWKEMLRCHAHDSISGSGVDAIEEDVMNRLRQVLDIGNGLYTRSLAVLQKNIDCGSLPPDAVVLTVYNPSPRERDEVVSAVVDMPWLGPRPRGQFTLRDAETGAPVPVQCVSRKSHWAVLNPSWDASSMMRSERFTVYFEATELPGLGYASYYVDREGSFAGGSLVSAANTLENEALRAAIQPDGTITLLDKRTGITYPGLHYFVDEGEAGHAWMHLRPARDRAVDSRGFPVSIALEEDGPLLARYRVECRMRIPTGLEENGGDPWQRLDGVGNEASRGREERELAIISWITLRKNGTSLEVTTRFENNAEDHRLRVMLPTHRPGTCCHAESALDVVERETVFGPESVWQGAQGVSFPMQRFVDVSDGQAGLAFISAGLREYEVTQDADRTIAVTLLRAYEVNLTTVSRRWETRPEMKRSQAPGMHEFSYRIYPHAGTYAEGGVLTEAERHVAPLDVVQAGAAKGIMPGRHGFLKLEPPVLQLAAFKQAESVPGYVLRLYNPTADPVNCELRVPAAVTRASFLTLEERPTEKVLLKNERITFTAGPKKILTVLLETE